MLSKKAGKLIAIGYAIIILLSIFVNPDLYAQINYEDATLSYLLKTIFTSIIPIAVSLMFGFAFIQTNRSEILLIFCGMLLLGLSSITTSIFGVTTNSRNFLITIYTTSAFASAVCHFHASIMLTFDHTSIRSKEFRLGRATFGICLFFSALIFATLKQLFPAFICEQGFTKTSTVILWVTTTLYFYSFYIFYKQYKKDKQILHYWYSLALFMFSIAFFFTCTRSHGCLLNRWIFRFALYIGTFYALISVLQVFRMAKANHSSLSEFLKQTFLQTKNSLHHSESLIHIIFEGIKEPVFLKNCKGQFIAVNTAFCLAIGQTNDNIIGKTFVEVFHDPKNAKQIMENDNSIFYSSVTRTFEQALPTGNGTRLFLTSKSPWLDETGRVLGIIGVAQDITDRKEMELKLKEQSEELKNQNKRITDFFVNISHDLKTPLTIILLCIDLLEKNMYDKKNITVMKQNCYRLGKLILNLLDISKLDGDNFEPNWEEIDIIEAIKHLIESVSQYIENKNLVVNCEFSHEEKYIYTDRSIFERIIVNLISNAIKYSNRGGEILVQCTASSNKINLSIKDTGIGIPDDKKDLIFNRFAQLNSSRVGSGIGLALTKSLVELLGGKIWFESEEGVGSEFFVELPILHLSQSIRNSNNTKTKNDRFIEMELSDLTD